MSEINYDTEKCWGIEVSATPLNVSILQTSRGWELVSEELTITYDMYEAIGYALGRAYECSTYSGSYDYNDGICEMRANDEIALSSLLFNDKLKHKDGTPFFKFDADSIELAKKNGVVEGEKMYYTDEDSGTELTYVNGTEVNRVRNGRNYSRRNEWIQNK